MLGDIVGKAGRRVVANNLSYLKDERGLDVVIANVENAAGGFGLTRDLYKELLDIGINIFTSGNHIFDNKDILQEIDSLERLLRPANYPAGVPSKGFIDFYIDDNRHIFALNLQGRVFMPSIDCPFRIFDCLYDSLSGRDVSIIIDFHGEATAEKQAFGMYVNGRATAVIGTHTHVQTNDERILTGGTAYITDIGMCGVIDSVIGMDVERSIRHITTQMPVRFTPAKGKAIMQGAIISVEGSKALSIERINILEDDYVSS
ncbi:MAG: TIGR00282 family metallophosphoesterase [bacterium]